MLSNEQFTSFLKEGAKELGIDLNNEQVMGFVTFKSILLEWNEKMNLTAVTDDEGFLVKHYLDSLSIERFIERDAYVVDVGTGAGFPGIPLLLARGDIKLSLLESLNKRLLFLSDALERLGFMNVSLIHSRAEDAGKSGEHREKYSVAVSRAVARLPLLAEYCLPLVKPGGFFIAMKGPGAVDEVEPAMSLIEKMGGELSFVEKINLPTVVSEEVYQRTILVIRKVRQTPAKYPRTGSDLTRLYKKNV